MFIGNGFLNKCLNWGFARIQSYHKNIGITNLRKLLAIILNVKIFGCDSKKKELKKEATTEQNQPNTKCRTNLMLFKHVLCVPNEQHFNAYVKYRAIRMEKWSESDKYALSGFSIHLSLSFPLPFFPILRPFSLSLFDSLSFTTTAPFLFAGFSVFLTLCTVQTH